MANNSKQCFNTHYQSHCHPTTKSLWLCSSVYCRPPHQSRRIWWLAATNQKRELIQLDWHTHKNTDKTQIHEAAGTCRMAHLTHKSQEDITVHGISLNCAFRAALWMFGMNMSMMNVEGLLIAQALVVAWCRKATSHTRAYADKYLTLRGVMS